MIWRTWRYNQVVIATDAGVDGMHIRLLLITFFLQFFPELIRQGHLFVLQTPLFRVRNKKKTFYCYDDAEREAAIKTLGKNPEITRFKGLGEISPDEFKHFIGDDIRLDPPRLTLTSRSRKCSSSSWARILRTVRNTLFETFGSSTISWRKTRVPLPTALRMRKLHPSLSKTVRLPDFAFLR